MPKACYGECRGFYHCDPAGSQGASRPARTWFGFFTSGAMLLVYLLVVGTLIASCLLYKKSKRKKSRGYSPETPMKAGTPKGAVYQSESPAKMGSSGPRSPTVQQTDLVLPQTSGASLEKELFSPAEPQMFDEDSYEQQHEQPEEPRENGEHHAQVDPADEVISNYCQLAKFGNIVQNLANF